MPYSYESNLQIVPPFSDEVINQAAKLITHEVVVNHASKTDAERVAETVKNIAGHEILLAMDTDGLAGVATYTIGGKPGAQEVELEYLASDPRKRRRGIGSLLLQQVEIEGRAAGARRVTLISANNQDTFDFYHNRGYSRARDLRHTKDLT